MAEPAANDATLRPWRVRAVNLPEHADNPVHTDAGARAAGHERALVAGTTVYVYLTHVPLSAWGRRWAEHGGGEVRFRSPVFDEDTVDVLPVDSTPAPGGPGSTEPADSVTVEARSRGATRATFRVWHDAPPAPPPRGDRLPDLVVPLDDTLTGYPARVGDDPSDPGIAHPCLTTVLGNRAMLASVVDGPWIHVRSHVTHHALADIGSVAVVESSLVDRFDSRAGERVVLDVRVLVDGAPVWTVEHEAIVRLA